MILPRYILRILGGRILASLLVLIGILQIIDMLEITPKVLVRGLGAEGLAHYALLRLPRLFEQAAPLAVLAGSIFAFTQLAQQSAVTALRSTGLSMYRLLAMASPAAVAVLVLQLSVGLFVAPRTDRALDTWWRSTAPAAERPTIKAKAFRVGQEIVVATPADDSGARLKNISIYRRDPQGRLTQQTTAPFAAFGGADWTLRSPRFQTVTSAGVTEGMAAQMTWRGLLQPSDVRTLFWGDNNVVASTAHRALEGGASVRPASYYETQIQRAWAAPMAALVMLMIAAPIAMVNFRGGGGSVIALCLGAGLLYLVVDGLLTAVGENGAAPAVLAAWAAPAMFAAGGLAVLLRMEG